MTFTRFKYVNETAWDTLVYPWIPQMTPLIVLSGCNETANPSGTLFVAHYNSATKRLDGFRSNATAVTAACHCRRPASGTIFDIVRCGRGGGRRKLALGCIVRL